MASSAGCVIYGALEFKPVHTHPYCYMFWYSFIKHLECSEDIWPSSPSTNPQNAGTRH